MTIDRQAAQELSYYHKVSMAPDTYCEPVEIPGGDLTSVVYDLFTEGAGVIETTLSPVADIEADDALWRLLPEFADISPAVKAVRAKSTASAVFVLRVQ